MRPKNRPLILVGFCIMCCLYMALAEGSSTEPQPVSPPDVLPKVLATCELPGQWKATLLSRPITHALWLINGKMQYRTDTLYYVEALPEDSNTPRRVWQMTFLADPSIPQSIPRDFILGPGDGQSICVAVLQTFSIHFFVLDSLADMKPYEETGNVDTVGPPPVSVLENNPNAIAMYSLWKKFGEKSLPGLGRAKISLDAISCSRDSWMLHLNVDEQRLAVRCIPGPAEPNYVVYRVTKPARQDTKGRH